MTVTDSQSSDGEARCLFPLKHLVGEFRSYAPTSCRTSRSRSATASTEARCLGRQTPGSGRRRTMAAFSTPTTLNSGAAGGKAMWPCNVK